MKADAIIERILSDAREAAAQTLSAARARAEAMHQEAKDKMEDKCDVLYQETERDAEVLRSRMLRMAELDQRKALLQTKREVIEQVFDIVLGNMRTMPDQQRMAYNKRLLLEAAQGGELIICEESDATLFNEKFLALVNGELQRTGKRPVAMSMERRPTDGGFILKNQGMEINCTYAAVLAQIKPSLEAEVAQMLFGQEVK